MTSMSDHIQRENERLLSCFRKEGVQIRILNKKDGYQKWWEKAAMWLVRLFNRSVDDFITVFFDGQEARIYWSASGSFRDWSINDHAVFRHECVHVLQAMRISRSRLGALLFSLAYLFLLPAVWTMRAKFEREAYTESARTLLQYGVAPRDLDKTMDRWARYFYGSDYLFMDPISGGGFRPGKSLRQSILNGELSPLNGPLREIGFTPNLPPKETR